MEPSLSIYGIGCDFGPAVVSLRDGFALEENLVVLTYLHFHTVQHTTHTTQRDDAIPAVARHGGGALRESVTHYHADAAGVHKLFHLYRHGSTGGGEEVLAFKTQILEQQGDDGLLVELVFHLQTDRRHQSAHAVLHVVLLAHTQSVEHEGALHGRTAVYLLHHTGIYLLPETGNGRHAGGMHLKHGLKHILRLQIHTQRTTVGYAQIAPGTLEDVGEGKEVENYVLVAQRQCRHMTTEGRSILPMGLHHALRQARGTTGVEDVGQVVRQQLAAPLFHLFLVRLVLAHSQELLKGDAILVLRIALDVGIEENEGPVASHAGQCHTDIARPRRCNECWHPTPYT